MYAVIESGGKQHRVIEGETLRLELMSSMDPDQAFDFDKVLMIGQGESIEFGTPYLPEAKVSAVVVGHGRHKKINIIKMRRRKHYRRHMGHRQHYTEVRITAIGGSLAKESTSNQ